MSVGRVQNTAQETQHVFELSSAEILGARVGGVGFTRDLGDLDQPAIHLVLQPESSNFQVSNFPYATAHGNTAIRVGVYVYSYITAAASQILKQAHNTPRTLP